MTIVINLFAGPGAGKSSTAAGLFHIMKYAGYKVELVTEYAKELHYDGILNDRSIVPLISIFAEQNRRMERLRGKVDFIITDAPLLLNAYYGEPDMSHVRLITTSYWNWNNVDYFINRVKPYAKYGRHQSEKEAVKIDQDIAKMIYQLGVETTNIVGDVDASMNIFYDLIEKGYLEIKE